MRNIVLSLLPVCLLIFSACGNQQKKADEVLAKKSEILKADVMGVDGVLGEVTLEPVEGGVKITYMVRNLPKGKTLASHIHENPKCDPPKFESAGSHFNPTKVKHGAPGSKEHHVGDLGNFEVDKNGVLKAEKVFDHISLDPNSENYIRNRSLIIHAGKDKFTQPVGDAGGRLGCAIL